MTDKFRFSSLGREKFRLAFRGFLAVELMEFDYAGKHYSYHGKKVENAVNRLTAEGGPRNATTAELVIWGKAVNDWKASQIKSKRRKAVKK